MTSKPAKKNSNAAATAAIGLAMIAPIADVSGLVMWLLIDQPPAPYGLVLLVYFPLLPVLTLLCGIGGLWNYREAKGRGKKPALFALGILAMYILGLLVWGVTVWASGESS